MPTFSQGLTALYNLLDDLRNDCISALNEKGVSALNTTKLSQIADKIREISTSVSEAPFNIFFDFNINPISELGLRTESQGRESAFQEGVLIDSFDFSVPSAFNFEELQSLPSTITADYGAYGTPDGITGLVLEGLDFSLPTDFEMSNIQQFAIDSNTDEYILEAPSSQYDNER